MRLSSLGFFLRLPGAVSLALLLALAASAPARADVPTPGDGVLLRSFLHDAVEASGEGDSPAARASELRGVFADHPELVTWAGEGRDLRVILREADLETAVTAMTGTDDLAGFVRNSVQRETEKWLKQWVSQGVVDPQTVTHALLRAGQPASRTAVLDPVQKFAKYFSQLDRASRLKLLETMGDTPFLGLSGQINQTLTQASFSGSDAVKLMLNPDSGFSTPNPAMQTFMNRALPRYFDSLSLEDKRKLVQNLLKLPPRSTVEAQLAAVLECTGPVMQKIFQLVGRDAKSPLLQAVMVELQANIKAFDGKVARAMVEKRLGAPIESYFTSFDEKPLAAATMGQVHRAVLKETGETVIVKVRRPTVQAVARREIVTLTTVVAGTPAEPLIRKVKETLDEELDFRLEAANLEAGEVYVSHKLGIDIARRVEEIPAFEDLLVTRLAAGTKISELSSAEDLVLRGRAMENVLRRWFDEAVFGTGFFHGDLHPGNVFIAKTPGVKPGYRLTLIDFGNAGRLPVALRRGFMRLVVSAAVNDPDEMLKALDEIGSIPAEKRSALRASLGEVATSGGTITQKVDGMMVRALEMNIELPSSLLAFNRGRMFLEKELLHINKRLTLLDPAGRLPRFDFMKVYAGTSLKRIGLSAPKSLVSAAARENSLVTSDLVTLVVRNVKTLMSYFKPCQAFLEPKAAP